MHCGRKFTAPAPETLPFGQPSKAALGGGIDRPVGVGVEPLRRALRSIP
jgi:hypothetical protein